MIDKLSLLRKVGYITSLIATAITFAISSFENVPIQVYQFALGGSVILNGIAFFCEKLYDIYNEMNINLTNLTSSISHPISLNFQDTHPFETRAVAMTEPIRDDEQRPQPDTNRSIGEARVIVDRRTGEILDYVKGLTPRTKN